MNPLMRMRAVWGAIVMSHVVFVAVAWFVTRAMPEGIAGVDSPFPFAFGLVFVFIGTLAIAASALIRRFMRRRAEQSENPQATRFQALIIGLALTDFASTLGLVHALLTGGLTIAAVLFAEGFIAAIWHYPVEA